VPAVRPRPASSQAHTGSSVNPCPSDRRLHRDQSRGRSRFARHPAAVEALRDCCGSLKRKHCGRGGGKTTRHNAATTSKRAHSSTYCSRWAPRIPPARRASGISPASGRSWTVSQREAERPRVLRALVAHPHEGIDRLRHRGRRRGGTARPIDGHPANRATPLIAAAAVFVAAALPRRFT
jgi:hypothetical protein